MSYTNSQIQSPAGSFLKAKWALVRITFYFFSAMTLLTGGLFCWFLMPLYSWYFFGDLNFTKYTRFLYPIILMGIRIEVRYFRHGNYRKHFNMPLAEPPRPAPLKTHLRIRDTWTGPEDHCNGCISCCVLAECPLIDFQKKTCLIYGSFYWNYFHCGRYPENQGQIDYYQCPKWNFEGAPANLQ